MSLKHQLETQMKASMKNGDKVRLGVVRFALSKIKNVEIDQGELDDKGVMQIIRREVKQTKEAIEQFKQGDRQDLVESEQAKVKILEEFLPAEMSEEAVSKLVDQAIKEHGQNMGQVMGAVMKAAAGQTDGRMVAKLVKERLAS